MVPHLVTCLRWHLARGLHAADALLLDYRWPRVSAWRERLYPPGTVHECPPWAMRPVGRPQRR